MMKNVKEKFKNTSIYHFNKKNKIRRINLPMETKDLYAETYKKLMKEIKDDTNR